MAVASLVVKTHLRVADISFTGRCSNSQQSDILAAIDAAVDISTDCERIYPNNGNL